MSKEGLKKIGEKVTPFWKDVFLNISRVETGKGGVGGYSTRHEPAHMVKSLDKSRW